MRVVWRIVTVSASFLVGYALVAPGRIALAQQRPGIRAIVTPPEGCSVSELAQPEDLYSFIMAEIQALSFARAGERASRWALAGGNDPVDQMAKTMTDLRQAQIEDTCAGFVLSPYTGSKNQNVATASRYLAFAYEELGKMTNDMLGITMQSSIHRNAGNSTRYQLSELKKKRDEIIRNMNDAVNVSLSLLLDPSHRDQDGKPDLLILTRAQRIALMDYLHSQFPSLADKKIVEPSDDFTKQAALIQSFMAGNYDSRIVTSTPK